MTNEEEQASINATTQQLLVNLDRRFDSLDLRLDTIEREIVRLHGAIAGAKAGQDENKKKLRHYRRRYKPSCLPSLTSETASTD